MLQPFADAHRIYHVIEPALRAPSVYNTQPWSFRITADDRIELRASPGGGDGDGPGAGRWDLLLHSPAPGPWAREYAISCGAALLNLRLAVRVLGHDPVVTLVPDPSGDPGLLASVEIVTGRTHQASALDQELYEAIWQRHTDRWPFSDTPVRAGILVEMERAAAREHGWLRLLHGPFARAWLTVAAHADSVLAAARDSRRGCRPRRGPGRGPELRRAGGAVPGGARSVDGGQRERLRHPGRRSRSPPGEGPFPGPGLPARRSPGLARPRLRPVRSSPAPAVFRGCVLSGTPSS